MNITAPHELCNNIVDCANGDARQIIQAARFVTGNVSCVAAKDLNLNMYDATRRLLTSKCATSDADYAINVLQDAGHITGGLMLENYSEVSGSLDKMSEFMEGLSLYDNFNHWRYAENRDDEGLAHCFLANNAQVMVSENSRYKTPDIKPCKRSFYNTQTPNRSVVMINADLLGAPKFVNKADIGYMNLIV
jgi:hypothetical protein